MANLEAAVEAYRAAQDQLPDVEAKAAAMVQQHRALLDRRRAELAAAIVAASEAGARQVDIIRITGYARESVRRILRAGGVERE